jgi:Helicase associated domain
MLYRPSFCAIVVPAVVFRPRLVYSHLIETCLHFCFMVDRDWAVSHSSRRGTAAIIKWRKRRRWSTTLSVYLSMLFGAFMLLLLWFPIPLSSGTCSAFCWKPASSLTRPPGGTKWLCRPNGFRTGFTATTIATTTRCHFTKNRTGFVGDYSKRNEQWNVKFEKLQEYKAVHGDCLVPERYQCDDGTKLGQWVQVQRGAPRYTSEDGKRLGEQRRQALDSVRNDFVSPWKIHVQLQESLETGPTVVQGPII